MGETFVKRVTSRVDDVAWRIEIGLADFEMDDIAPLCLQRSRPFASNAFAFTRTSNAVSVPRRAIRLARRSSRALVMTVELKCQSGSDHYSAVA
jgi:hypothetical protein